MKNIFWGVVFITGSSIAYAAIDVESIMNTKTVQPITQKQEIDEQCIFDCNLNRMPSSFETREALLKLNTILQEKYGLKGNVSCQLYRKVKPNSPYEMRTQMPLPYGNDSVDFYSDEVLNDSDTWRPDARKSKVNLANANDPLYLSLGDLGKDIYADMVSMAALNGDLSSSLKNGYVSTFKKRHKFIEKSCGKEFITAYDKFLNNQNSDRERLAEEKEENRQRTINEALERQQAEEQARQEKNEAERKKWSDELAQEAQNRKELDKCMQTRAFKMADAASYTNLYLKVFNKANQDLREEDEISKISGVENLKAKYLYGQTIQNSKNSINYYFNKYKEHGGTASSPEKIGNVINPCK